jgi:hypothetical protein
LYYSHYGENIWYKRRKEHTGTIFSVKKKPNGLQEDVAGFSGV